VEGDEPGSVNYNERLWRRVRNEKIIYENQPHREHAGKKEQSREVTEIYVESANLTAFGCYNQQVQVDGIPTISPSTMNRQQCTL